MPWALIARLLVLLTVALLCGCGGGGGSSIPPPDNTLRVTTTSVPAATQGQSYSATLQSSGGTGTKSWSLVAGSLPSGLTLASTTGLISGTPTQSGTFDFTVQVSDSSTPKKTASQEFSLIVNVPPPPQVATSALPNARLGAAYAATLSASGGTPALTWSLIAGTLPGNLTFHADGVLSGTANQLGSFGFTVQVIDAQARTAQRALTLQVVAAPGRNDSVATATSLSNGTFRASLSPYGASGADSDYYRLTGTPGATVTVAVNSASDLMDPVIEIVDANEVRLQVCRDPGDDSPPLGVPRDATPTSFDDSCINDDISLGLITDSQLELRVPNSPVIFFVHVVDYRGTARPEMVYDITVSGAN